ncbi:hypothetical protein DPMN_133527 [Dreissena polymorpha]|uniref:Uncharacterized protein n=1 Tax=Dreissena polymorpha TaxID=45954 RepID=A0A9D4FYI4_DREPO|nr:hypothetical protein DPMN_133527 [Dreissena polymorpha]
MTVMLGVAEASCTTTTGGLLRQRRQMHLQTQTQKMTPIIVPTTPPAIPPTFLNI